MGLLDDAIREHLELKRRHGADPGEVARLEQEALGPARRTPEPPQTAHDEEHEYAGAVAYDEQVDEPAGYGEPEGYGDDEPEAAPVAEPSGVREPEAVPAHEDDVRHDDVRFDDEVEDEPAPQSAAGPIELEEGEPLPPPDNRRGDDGLSQPTAAFEVDDLHEAMRPPSGARALPEEDERGREASHPEAAAPPPAPEPDVEAPPRRERHGSEIAREGELAEEEKGDDVLEETPDFLQETPEHDRLWFEQRPPRDFDF